MMETVNWLLSHLSITINSTPVFTSSKTPKKVLENLSWGQWLQLHKDCFLLDKIKPEQYTVINIKFELMEDTVFEEQRKLKYFVSPI